MSWRLLSTILLLGVINGLDFGSCARILAVCPTVSISHQVVVHGLAVALNKRGHELVVVTTDPLNDPNLKNYTEIDFSYLYNDPNFFNTNFIAERGNQNLYHHFSDVEPLLHIQAEKMLKHSELRKLYALDSNEKFDLILLELNLWHAFLPLSVRFDAPIVGISSLGLILSTHYASGNPILSSHPSHWELETKYFGPLIPWKRLDSFVRAWLSIGYVEYYYIPKQEEIARKYFGNDIPSLRDIQRNVSLIFVNQQLPIAFARPNLPNIIEINSFHVSKRVEPLPKDLQSLLDEATEGFVYMSLGSNVKSRTMTDKLRGEFVAAFSELPYKVIWKFENDTFRNKPDNLIFMRWTPQEAILAHPNIKVFIYQGGLQSTEEAITHAVPLIGLPVAYDQDTQIRKLVSVGVARELEITTIKAKDLVEAISAVATDVSYKQRMIELRSLLEDRSHDLLKNAVWWTEHVIRHRGAPYLRSNFADEPWYRRQDMDIVAILSIAFAMLFILLFVSLYKLLSKVVRICTVQSTKKKNKKISTEPTKTVLGDSPYPRKKKR